MSATLVAERPPARLPADGGIAARRAVARWGWRLLVREWRQQLLVLALIVFAVAATIVGSAVAKNTPSPADAGFGTAQDAATLSGQGPKLAAQIEALQHRFGKVDVIENESLRVPGSIETYDLRSQDPHGPYGQPMLALVSGRYPATAGEVALTSGLAGELGVSLGGTWQEGGVSRRVVGIVENPQSLLDEFALVVPGQVTSPTQVRVLFDAPGVPLSTLGPDVSTPASVAQSNPLNPETVSLAVLTVGMLLIALVAVGGFTVLAQRRLRSLGMLASIGATDRQVGLVVRANGAAVGAVGAVVGTVLGMVLWLAYRPSLEQSSHHLIGVLALPWVVVGAAIVLAVLASYLAAARPARTVTRVPIIAALSGRPAAPKQIHRSAVPGLVFLFAGFLLLGYAGGTNRGSGSGGTPELLLGIVALIPAVILLAPFFLVLLAKLGSRATVSVRLALRDLARYRARSGSALAAISLSVMIAVIIALAAASRYGNVWDYAGPNLASDQLVVYTPVGGGGGPGGPAPAPTAAQLRSMAAAAESIGTSLGARHVVELEQGNVSVGGSSGGRQFTGNLYVATPQLLQAYGISASQLTPGADLLTSRPGFAGAAGVSLQACLKQGPPQPIGTSGREFSSPCEQSAGIADPVLQEVGALPTGTSAPNTVLTEHAVQVLGLQPTLSVDGWLIQTNQAITAVQIHDAQLAAAALGMTVESKNDEPSSSQVIGWATVFGIVVALCVLAMSIGLIRSETAADLRTLTATGASGVTRRNITAATAGGLGLVGAVLGTFAGYVGMLGWLRSNSLNGGISALANVPVLYLLVLLLGIPAVGAAAGWLLGGREPPAIAHQPME